MPRLNRIPFLFRPKSDLWVVKTASWDYVYYDSHWAGDEDLGDCCLVPDIDQVHMTHFFSTENEALTFIKNWWKMQED